MSIGESSAARIRGLRGTGFAAATAWLVFGACCLAPLAWVAVSLVGSPEAWGAIHPMGFHLRLLGRTLLYNICVAGLATLFALPVALVIGRGRGRMASGLTFVTPAALLLPSIVYAYGWMQVLRLLGIGLEVASAADVARCVWTLATWLWPVPAGIIGLSLRRMDSDLQQQALLDGAYWRVTARRLAGPALAAAAIVMILAMQEFAVYEPTGISVVATEVRTVFDTGQAGWVTGVMPGSVGESPAGDQRQNAAAAIVTSAPLLLVIGLFAWLAWRFTDRQAAGESIEGSHWPRALDARKLNKWLACGVVIVTTIVPLIAMMASIKRFPDPVRIWRTFSPPVLGTLLVGGLTACAALIAATCGLVRRMNWPIAVGLLSFLIGGQMLAIALIRLYNRPAAPWTWIYSSSAIVMMAYVARFGWLAMWAARSTWNGSWRQLRDLAAVDGAGPIRTARRVILPLAGPMLLSSSMLVMLLAMTEVPSTVLLQPMRPPLLVPQLMAWVHTLRSDDMLEGSLLMAGIVIALFSVAVALVRRNRNKDGEIKRDGSFYSPPPSRPSRHSALGAQHSLPLLLSLLLLLPGCGDSGKPDETWLETGTGQGQVVYPRGICYSKSDDSFFVVDRLARIQHLDRNGKFIEGFRMPDFAQGKPVGLSVDPDGNLWIPDTHYSRIMIFTPAGKFLRQFGKSGKGKGEFIYPCDIAFDDKGRVFISEFGDHDRVQVFDLNLNYLFEFGRFGQGDGEFSRPQSMVIVGDTMYVSDACNHRISVWRTDGTFVRNIGTIGSGLGQFRYPYGLDVDAKGRLVVCEFGNNRVQLVDPRSGKGLATWGRAGREPGELAYPWGVAVDKKNRVVAVDAGNNRLQLFRF